MTSIARHPARFAQPEPSRKDAARTLAARWSLRGVSVDEAGRVAVGDELSKRAMLVIEVTARGEVASWVEDASGRRTPTERAIGAAVVEDAEAGLVHADAPGVLRATWRADGRPVFARTALLERLGVAGGRGEFVKALGKTP